MENYILILKLTKPKQLIDIFGETVIKNIKKNIDQKFEKAIQKLLSRHIIKSELKSSFGQWQITFAIDNTDFMVDTDEQLKFLNENSKEIIFEIIKEEFGTANGSKINFKLAIFPLPTNLEDNQKENYLMKKLNEYSIIIDKYQNLITREKLAEIINKRKITSYLQPLISLKEEKIIGYEVLTRGPENSPLFGAADLFGAAQHFNLMKELELAAAIEGLGWGLKLPAQYQISINASPELLIDKEFYQQISQANYQKLLPRTIFEITEHMPLDKVKQIKEKILTLKELEIKIALDDTGCGYFDLEVAQELKPEIVKLCITIINKLNNPNMKRQIHQTVKNIKKLGSLVLGEGVEKKEQAQILKEYNIDLAQGYYYGYPQPAKEIINSL